MARKSETKASKSTMTGKGAHETRSTPWTVKTPSYQSEFIAFRDEDAGPPALVVQVSKSEFRYHLRCLEDVPAMLKAQGDWMPLGNADEQKPAAAGTLEAWGRAPLNPVGGWYGVKRAYVGALLIMCRQCWRRSALSRSSITRKTIASGGNEILCQPISCSSP
jgi:hypothetical protein